MPGKRKTEQDSISFAKSPTGISGLDEILGGGIPSERPTLLCGGPGCGKTLIATEFLVKGATLYGEPGVLMTFEEKAEELASNVASLGFNLDKLRKQKLLKVDYVHIDRSEIDETGEYDLSGLFIRLEHAIDTLGAKRVVLDTIENIFSGLANQSILRAEIRRLFQFLKNKKVTTIITGEKGDGTLTRQGLEEYVSDCVILLDHRITNQISTRLLRVVKYRGSVHGTNEYPFLIDEDGISVFPITSLKLESTVTSERISSGIFGLDQMLGGRGFFKGSSILVSGTSGTGKTSIGAAFASRTCERGEKCVFLAFEESPAQIIRNMHSVDLHLERYVKSGLLRFHASRPTVYGLEMHLVAIHKLIREFEPAIIVLDPVTNLTTMGSFSEVKSMLIRLIDFVQAHGITIMFTALTMNSAVEERIDENLSSLVDTWLMVREIENNGERNRGMYVMKSRGMSHSNQIRELIITDKGMRLVDVYMGPNGVLVGSARDQQQMSEATGEELKVHAISRRNREIERKKILLETRIANLKDDFESAKDELNRAYNEETLRKEIEERNRAKITRRRSDINETSAQKPTKKSK